MARTSSEYNEMPFTSNADSLFDSVYTTEELKYEMFMTIHPRTDHPLRVKAEKDVWFRGAIVKALDEMGVTVSTIHKRNS